MILREIHVRPIGAIFLDVAYNRHHLALIDDFFEFHDIHILRNRKETSALRAFSAVTRLTVDRRPQVRGRCQLV